MSALCKIFLVHRDSSEGIENNKDSQYVLFIHAAALLRD